MKPGRVTRSAPAPAPARGGQETEEKLFSKLRREGTPEDGRGGGVGGAGWAGGTAGGRGPGPLARGVTPCLQAASP